jgi:site-specific DNA-methyltransferase (adenine-specific)
MPTEQAGGTRATLKSLIIRGDARVVIPGLPDNCFRCLLTDPPYGIGYVSDWNNGANAKPIRGDSSKAHQLLDEVLRRAWQKLKRDAAIYVFTTWKTVGATLEVVSRYYRVKNVLVWVKDSWGMGDLNGAYAGRHEMIVYAVKGMPWLRPPRDPDVLSYPRVPPMTRIHPAQKPLELLAYLITKSTRKGEAVLDPFAGAATTAAACFSTGRRYVCIEKDPGYYSSALRWIKSIRNKGNGGGG